MTIPTRDELIERAARMPTTHECHPVPADVADFALAEIRRAVAETLEALRDMPRPSVMGEQTSIAVAVAKDRVEWRRDIDARLAALRASQSDASQRPEGAMRQTEQPPVAQRTGASCAPSNPVDQQGNITLGQNLERVSSTLAPGTTEHDGPVAQLEEQPHSKRQREGSSPSGPTNQPQANSAVCIARLLSTEGFTDYIGQQVKRYALRNATDEQRRSFLKTQRRFKGVMQKLDRDEKKIVGAFIRNLEGMGFDTGLRIGLTAYQRECQSEQRVGGSMEGHARPKGTNAGSSPAPHTTDKAGVSERTRLLDESTYGNVAAPALSDADVLDKAAEILDKSTQGLGGVVREVAAKLRAASAPVPVPKPVDVFAAFAPYKQDRDGSWLTRSRDWFGPLAAALEQILAVPVHPDSGYSKRVAEHALSALRQRAQEASR